MFKNYSKSVIYALILVIAFLIIFFPQNLFTKYKFSVVQTISLPLRIISFPFRELKKILFYHWTYNEYMKLKKEVLSLKARLIGMDELLLENNRLSKLLDFKRKLVYPSMAAGVIGHNPSNWSAVIVIDKGSADGVHVSMPLVNAQGVVGKVSEVSEYTSKAILLSDASFSVPALVERSREVGLVSGSIKEGKCKMRYLSSNADVKVGDQIITSKLSSSFPEGILIGEVVEVKKSQSSPSIDCTIEPAVSLSQLEEVLIIQKQ